jgi:putative oxidoreductase
LATVVSQHSPDVAAVILRLVLGGTILAHGLNHAYGGGKLPGTARWFESIGIRPGKIHALFATVTEAGGGAALILGFLTPLAAGAVMGTMVVAMVANHLKNGFFIFRPGEGYEYVLFIACTCLALGALGGGRLSLDRVMGFHLSQWAGLGATAAIGLGGGGLLLATCWRPAPKT